jgi:hypothetical protein
MIAQRSPQFPRPPLRANPKRLGGPNARTASTLKSLRLCASAVKFPFHNALQIGYHLDYSPDRNPKEP